MQSGLPDNDDPAQYKQWVCWKHIVRDGKASKLPMQTNGKPASVVDAATWSTFEDASNAAKTNGWGIGFVLTSADPFVVIDLDKSNAPDNEALHKRLLDEFSQTYSEISPSGIGFHIFCIGKWKTSGNRFGSVKPGLFILKFFDL